MDLRTYPTKRVLDEAAPYHCTICVEPCEPSEGFIDIGPADVLCVPCASRAAGALEPTSETATDAPAVAAITVTDFIPLSCDDCGRAFSRPAALGAHRRSHRAVVVA